MRSLSKTEAPAVLEANADRWTRNYAMNPGGSRPWAHEDIKNALTAETGGKCAYCEARILHIIFGDIEHIIPKSARPDLVVAWENLTLVCGRCNQNKGAKYDDSVPFVNPYADPVTEHILLAGPVAFGLSERGDYTIDNLDLNEPARIIARQRAITQAETLIRLRDRVTGYARERLDHEISQLTEQGEYTAAVQFYLTNRNRNLAAGAAA